MDLTEKEAREKTCPFLEDSNCIGSLCMVWRWTATRLIIVSHGEDEDPQMEHIPIGCCGVTGRG